MGLNTGLSIWICGATIFLEMAIYGHNLPLIMFYETFVNSKSYL